MVNDGQAEPRSAAPLDVPMSTITKVGMGLWALGLVATTSAWATGHLPGVAPATCVVGLLIGLCVLYWLRRRDTKHGPRAVPTAGS